jgi:hypothetical protein
MVILFRILSKNVHGSSGFAIYGLRNFELCWDVKMVAASQSVSGSSSKSNERMNVIRCCFVNNVTGCHDILFAMATAPTTKRQQSWFLRSLRK